MSSPLSSKLSWELMNPILSSTLNPIISSPLSSAVILKDIVLINGSTTINHGLNRLMQGWFLVDINGAATIYRSALMNDLTLTLTSNAAVTVNIGVF
jgi:hypothetical protein